MGATPAVPPFAEGVSVRRRPSRVAETTERVTPEPSRPRSRVGGTSSVPSSSAVPPAVTTTRPRGGPATVAGEMEGGWYVIGAVVERRPSGGHDDQAPG